MSRLSVLVPTLAPCLEVAPGSPETDMAASTPVLPEGPTVDLVDYHVSRLGLRDLLVNFPGGWGGRSVRYCRRRSSPSRFNRRRKRNTTSVLDTRCLWADHACTSAPFGARPAAAPPTCGALGVGTGLRQSPAKASLGGLHSRRNFRPEGHPSSVVCRCRHAEEVAATAAAVVGTCRRKEAFLWR